MKLERKAGLMQRALEDSLGVSKRPSPKATIKKVRHLGRGGLMFSRESIGSPRNPLTRHLKK